MKKLICILASAVMLFASCGKAEDTNVKTPGAAESAAGTVKTAKTEDIDLTEMSSTMVYSQVYDMINNTDKYEGKTVKMKGIYYPSDDGYYHFCVIADATACCSQGIEFIASNGEYPENGEEFTISGTFETYYEGTNKYCHINNSAYC